MKQTFILIVFVVLGTSLFSCSTDDLDDYTTEIKKENPSVRKGGGGGGEGHIEFEEEEPR